MFTACITNICVCLYKYTFYGKVRKVDPGLIKDPPSKKDEFFGLKGLTPLNR